MGSSGNFGAFSASICSVDAVYDCASLIINCAASVRSLSYCDLADFTEESAGPPSWLPTSVALAACASGIERAEALEFFRISSCGLTSCSVSAACAIHLPADSL
ncbi:hypothetical protein CG723_40960 [Streptomyces sp. CB01635]|nr:hypothetical protein CG723_40960 [Streptomyces sp. CB01635]